MASSHRFATSAAAGEVSALLDRPRGARALYVLAHGAGAGMTHWFMAAISARLTHRGVATMRYQFPFTEAGRRRPDRPTVCVSTVRAAVACATTLAPDLPLLAGGKSMGGRMTSLAAADASLPNVVGLAFLGYPLHPPGKPGTSRAEHLPNVAMPMLFCQGTRDKLAAMELIEPVCADLGDRATLHVVDGADHGFHVLKRSGRTDDDVLDELANTVRAFADRVAR